MKLDAIKKKELRGQILVFLGHVNPYLNIIFSQSSVVL